MNRNPLPGCSLEGMDDSVFDPFRLRFDLSVGPFVGKPVFFTVSLPQNYPFRGPQLTVATPLVHPMIHGGGLCSSAGPRLSYGHEWGPHCLLKGLAKQVQGFLESPSLWMKHRLERIAKILSCRPRILNSVQTPFQIQLRSLTGPTSPCQVFPGWCGLDLMRAIFLQKISDQPPFPDGYHLLFEGRAIDDEQPLPETLKEGSTVSVTSKLSCDPPELMVLHFLANVRAARTTLLCIYHRDWKARYSLALGPFQMICKFVWASRFDAEWYEDPKFVARNHVLFEEELRKRNGL